jgi:hypothetical protein
MNAILGHRQALAAATPRVALTDTARDALGRRLLSTLVAQAVPVRLVVRTAGRTLVADDA